MFLCARSRNLSLVFKILLVSDNQNEGFISPDFSDIVDPFGQVLVGVGVYIGTSNTCDVIDDDSCVAILDVGGDQ